MSCPPELELSMHADGALDADAASRVSTHVAGCGRCRAALAALRAEVAQLSAALAVDDEDLPLPAFNQPTPRAGFRVAATLALGAAGLAASGPAWLALALPSRFAWLENGLSWLNPFDAGGLINAGVRAFLFLSRTGDDIVNMITETAAAVVILSLIAWIAVALGRRAHVALNLAVIAVVSTLMFAPRPADALEIRNAEDGAVRVAAGETIDDTLIAVGSTVEIDGIVEGDLIAGGRTVVVRGRVEGQIVAVGQSVRVEGEAGNSVLSIGQTLALTDARIARNLFGFGSTVTASPTSRIGSNAVLFAGQTANLAGPIGRDVLGYGSQFEIGNAIGGNLTTRGSSVVLLGPARIAGDFTAYVPNEEAVSIAPGATIGGEQTTEIQAEEDESGNRYATVGFYVSQLLRFAGSFVAGLILLALVPGFRRVALTSPVSALIAGGIGLVTLAAVPIITLITLITVIGIPVALLGLMLYAASIYLAKIVLAHIVGRRLLEARGRSGHFAVALALGLLLVIVVVDLPFVGGWLNFLLTIMGLGIISMFGWDLIRRPSARSEAIA